MAYSLGLDLGARSIGWAALEMKDGAAAGLLGLGVRVFEAGVEGDIERGKDESRGAQRRLARLARRQTRRRRQRARTLYRVLAEAGLLPRVEHAPGRPMAIEIQTSLNRLDGELREKYAGDPAVQQLPYLLRARALDEALSAYEVGRALYHLGQRRGFLSNRKAKGKDGDEERGKVYGGIHELQAEMAGARTLGEYYSRVNPHEKRIRQRYTHRSMYQHEFEMIWAAQAPHHPAMTEELKARVSGAMFFQREIHDASELVGACEWEPEEKRAPIWSLDFQRFRVLQTVAHLRVQSPNGRVRPLTAEERRQLAAALDVRKEMTPTAAKDLLGIPRRWRFTIEEDKGSKLKGNTVGARLYELLKDKWAGMAEEDKHRFLAEIAGEKTDEGVQDLLRSRWGFKEEEAQKVAEGFALPQGYASLSVKAMRRAMPYLEEGLSVQEARIKAGYEIDPRVPVYELLPPLKDSGLEVRNPAVARTLTELRKVVNAIVRKWGKPEEIHIELARELKKSRDQRVEETKRMRERESLREAMKQRIAREVGIPEDQIRRGDIEKGLLYDECGGFCPYTGESLGSFTSLFTGNSRAQVEHIIPRSISLDDSFSNLTLCLVSENAVKGNRTPYEAYHHDPERYEQILERVRRFNSKAARQKLARFTLDTVDKQELFEQFSARHLNDTRYSSVLAARYLALLYGGEVVEGRRKIIKSTGQITADLRNLWDMNSILNDGPRKSREDHRHHAIDAAVLAVVSQKYVTELSRAAERAAAERRRRYAPVPPPWAGFKEAVAAAVAEVNISYRPDHRVTGALHKETYYSRVGVRKGGGDVVRTRKPVHALTKEQVGLIVDPGVRAAVEAKLAETGDPKKLENNWPELKNKNGAPVRIKSVRIEFNKAVRPIGQGHRQRWAEGSETHHVAVFEVTKGRKRVWDGEVVPMRDALERISAGRPVIDREERDGRGFLFSLAKNDCLMLKDPEGGRSGIWVVKKIAAKKQLTLVPQCDARNEANREVFSPLVGGLQKYRARKVVVTPLGEVVPSRE